MLLPPPLLALIILSLPALVHSTTHAPQQEQKPIQEVPFNSDSERLFKNIRPPGILNTLHSSLRQFPASLHHNGMSYFLASAPAGSLFYHGTQREEEVKGMEWLALEVEHAEMFARPWRRPPPGRGGGGPPPPMEVKGFDAVGRNNYYDVIERHVGGGSSSSGKTSREEREQDEEEESKGYLHIYQAKHDLKRLLYIDGLSAAKCPLGTLDSTDLVLLNNTLESSSLAPELPDTPTWHPGSDYDRAQGLCKLAEEWDLDGFIRMEAGLEIILCDFGKHLTLLSSRQRPASQRDFPNVPPPPHAADGMPGKEGEEIDETAASDIPGFEYMKALEPRYHGLPAGRITIDYSSMVSAYFYPSVNLSNPSNLQNYSNQPRLTNNVLAELQIIRDDLDEVLSTQSLNTQEQSIEWQSIADLIITRYSSRLPFIANEATSAETMLADLGVLLDVYIDYANISHGFQEERTECSKQYLRSVQARVATGTKSDGGIYSALLEVTKTICDVLFDARKELISFIPEVVMPGSSFDSGALDEEDGEDKLEDPRLVLTQVKERVEKLMKWLNWATWKECGRCGVDEVCFVAIWPWGGVEDHENPGCLGIESVKGRRGYWNFEESSLTKV